MTTINDISDLVRILRDDPAWAEAVRSVLLTQELQSLPERFDRFVELTRENNELVNRRLERLEDGQQRLEEGQQSLEERQQRLEEGQQRLENRMDRMDLEAASGTWKEATPSGEPGRTSSTSPRTSSDLSRGSILLARGRDTSPQFLDSIEAAEAQGLISESQADHVLLADIIIRARRGVDRRYVHGVFEVSRTIGQNDIRRARDRADAVAAATGEEAVAAVIGGTIQPPQRAQAEELDVQVLIPAMFNSPENDEETRRTRPLTERPPRTGFSSGTDSSHGKSIPRCYDVPAFATKGAMLNSWASNIFTPKHWSGGKSRFSDSRE